MRRASSVEPESVEWLVKGRVPQGKIVVIAGRPDQGKSLWTCWLASHVSQTSPVLLSNQEDDEAQDIVPRLAFAGAKMSRIFFPTANDFAFGYPVIPRDIEELERFVKQTGTVLGIFDSANQHIGSNVYSNQAVRQALTPLKQMCSRTGFTAVFVDHLKKSGGRPGEHVLEAFAGGGSGLIAAARVVYAFGVNPDDPDERVLAPAKANGSDDRSAMSYSIDVDPDWRPAKRGDRKKRLVIQTARLVLVSPSIKIDAKKVTSYTGANEGPVNAMTKAVCAEWLTGFLMFGPKDGKEVRDAGVKGSFSWSTIRRTSTEMGIVKVQVKKPGFGTGTTSTWELPKKHPALALGKKLLATRKAGGASTAGAS